MLCYWLIDMLNQTTTSLDNSGHIKTGCHSERSEESVFFHSLQQEILRCVQNDKNLQSVEIV